MNLTFLFLLDTVSFFAVPSIMTQSLLLRKSDQGFFISYSRYRQEVIVEIYLTDSNHFIPIVPLQSYQFVLRLLNLELLILLQEVHRILLLEQFQAQSLGLKLQRLVPQLKPQLIPSQQIQPLSQQLSSLTLRRVSQFLILILPLKSLTQTQLIPLKSLILLG